MSGDLNPFFPLFVRRHCAITQLADNLRLLAYKISQVEYPGNIYDAYGSYCRASAVLYGGNYDRYIHVFSRLRPRLYHYVLGKNSLKDWSRIVPAFYFAIFDLHAAVVLATYCDGQAVQNGVDCQSKWNQVAARRVC